jgi:hypothetical protein
MAPKIPYYVVIKGNGYFRPKASMRALGFERVRCGKDGPAAWAIADVWARRWEQAKRGEFVPQRKQMASLKAYPPGSIGEAFHRFRRTAEWAKKAPRTREEWERGWAHLEPLLADVAPGTISLEDMSESARRLRRAFHGVRRTGLSRFGGRFGRLQLPWAIVIVKETRPLGFATARPLRDKLCGGRGRLCDS